MNYVLGFVFDIKRCGYVLLIQKDKPDWQKGKWNGIGGKREEGEGVKDAMSRECQEETGMIILPEDWRWMLQIQGRLYTLNVLTSRFAINRAEQRESEELGIFYWCALPDGAIPNLHWMVPMCLDSDVKGPVTIWYEYEDGDDPKSFS